VAIVSFCVTLAALLQIPRLQDVETCLTAALVITGAYAWFIGVIWANLVLPMMDHEK
jgi:hypothetical protein